MHRAYSLLDIKGIDEDARVIEGVATTPNTDRSDDIVEPLGAQFTLPLPFLWQHGRDEFVGRTPVGHLIGATPTAEGIPVRVQIERTNEPGRLKDILDFAWQTLKKRLVRGLSIGFRPIDEPIPIKGSYGVRFPTWEWLELSAVTIPANADASITGIKSVVADLLARQGTSASGPTRSRVHLPGVAGATGKTGVVMHTYGEQIKSAAARRLALVARQNEIMGADDGQTLDQAQQDEFDTNQRDIEKIDGHLSRLEQLERTNKALARPVAGGTSDDGTAARGGGTAVELGGHAASVITVKVNRPPGIGFTRLVICKVASWVHLMRSGEFVSPHAIAQQRYANDHEVVLALKAAVPPALPTGATWAGPLTYAENLATEFVEFLRPATIIGKFGTNGIPALTAAPFNVRILGQDTGGTGYWVGAGKPKPLTKFDFSANALGFAKVAAISVIAEESARFSTPSIETLVRNGLRDALVERCDIDFIDPEKAVVVNVSPASITNGVAPIPSSGSTADQIRADLKALFGAFVAANVNPSGLVLIMTQTSAMSLGLLRNSLGQPEFPGITMNGGTLDGVPVIASQYAKDVTGTGATLHGNMVIAVNAPDIFLADDGDVTVDVSREASLEMSDAPTQDGSTGTGAALVSLWQNNLIGLRAERFINWQRRRAGAVAWLENVNW